MKKDLYQLVIENYQNMSRDDLKNIAVEALFKLYDVIGEEEFQKASEEIIESLELDL